MMSPPPPPDFALSPSPSGLNIGQGGIGTSTITVNGVNGFNGTVNLSASSLPSGVSASFNPPSTTSTSVLTLTVTNTAALGTMAATITGTSGSLTRSTSVSPTIQAASLTVSLSPKRAAVAAITQMQQFIATVTGNLGNLSVNWSVDGVAGGNAALGTISSSGLYTPPATGGTHTVTATSVALPSVSADASIAVTDLPGVFTYHNNLSRDGSNTQEYALTPTTVSTASFGKLFSCAVDGAVYTQPLWVPGLSIANGIHNVIFVATQHDSLYAFDADASPCIRYWKANLIDAQHSGTTGEAPVVGTDVGQGFKDIQPEVGVTGTPVIDPTTQTIYVVSKSENKTTQTFFQRLHALDFTTGNEQLNSPVVIAAQVPGTGDGSTTVIFDPKMHNQRSALALANGTVYVAWAAHEDATPYHGWLMGYNAANVQLQVGVFNATPNAGLAGILAGGGIWSGGSAPAVDSTGSVYVSTGNGVFDADITTNDDFGDSILRLDPTTGLNVTDWFTPNDQQILANADADVGAGGVVLLPDQPSGPVPHLLVEMGKGAVLYLINRDNMGHFQTGSNSQIVQGFFVPQGGLWGTPAFWQNLLYVGEAGSTLKQVTFDPVAGKFNKAFSSQSVQVFSFPGATPSVSSVGAANGIVWALDESAYGLPRPTLEPAVLHAFSANNLAVEYWNSSMAVNNRDEAGNAVKFVPPTIANGKVYVSTRTEITVYGLLPN